jgi:acetoin utilization protein AcuB
MTPNPERIDVRDSIAVAIDTLFELDVRHLPVVDENEELVGMVSDRDLRSHSLPATMEYDEFGTSSDGDRTDAPVSQIMRSDVQYVDPETDLHEVIQLMLDYKIGAVPVVDPIDGNLVGIVSYIDVLRAAQDSFV